jgi:hypothetical protein
MKKYLAITAAIMIFLAVFIPLASSSPDGLERVVENFGVKETAPIWNGVMSDYTIAAIANPLHLHPTSRHPRNPNCSSVNISIGNGDRDEEETSLGN